MADHKEKAGFSILKSLFGGLTGIAEKRISERQKRLDAAEVAAGTKEAPKKKKKKKKKTKVKLEPKQ